MQIPESPYWLLSKHKNDEALRALQWLRGWVPPQAVAKEFEEIQKYVKQADACLDCDKKSIPCPHPPSTFAEKFRDLLRKRVMKPTIMLFIISTFAQFSGLTAMRAYVVLTMKAFGVPMDANLAAVSPSNQKSDCKIQCIKSLVLDGNAAVRRDWHFSIDTCGQVHRKKGCLLDFDIWIGHLLLRDGYKAF